jgi:glycine dehydrogenase subunit 1
MNYVSITAEQRQAMLEAIGVDSVDDLFAAIPEEARFKGDLDLPPAASELELQRELQALAGSNRGANQMACFMGAGAYDHFVPSFIDQIISRGEFLTAYTPYQAEASQGSLQAFFEFQSQIARLAGLDIANASLYEGASSVAEAVTLALNVTGKRRVLVASTLHHDYRAVLKSHLEDLPVEMVTLPAGEDGVLSAAVVEEHADEDTACLVVQSPNIYGLLEDWQGLFEKFKGISGSKGKAPLAIGVFNPIACALLKSPGACGADVAVGEGQPLGVPLQFGGPYLGLFAAKGSLMRKMPGRLVGITRDESDRRAFSLILQTREQHIRGAKATSNVCTNQGLLALRATMYMTAVGPKGLREVAEQCWHKAHWLATRIESIDGYERRHPGEFFNEFTIRCPKPAQTIIDHAKTKGVLAGVDLSSSRVGGVGDERDLLIAVTEKRSRAEMERLVEALEEAAKV